MNGGVSEYLISWNIFLSKTLNKMFQIIRDFVCKQEEQSYRGAFCATTTQSQITLLKKTVCKEEIISISNILL